MQAILKEKSELEGLKLSNFKTYRTTAIKTVWF